MASWVYVFSQFTSEALLFEALFICVLCAAYTGYWILRKRRLGVIDSEVPANVVRAYLNALIGDAEQMRTQLFGLLAAAGIRLTHTSNPALMNLSQQPATGGGVDAHTMAQLAALEEKITEQTKTVDTVMKEKQRLEKELKEAKAGAAKGGGSEDGGELAQLQEKIKLLESKLSEYSVIEDDLANLKRLQQENAQLKAALEGKGVAIPTAVAVAAAAAPVEAAPPTSAPEPTPEPAPEAMEVAPVEAAPEPATPEPTPDPVPVAAATNDPAFEQVVDQVEQKLEVPEAAAAPDAAATPPEPEAPAVEVVAETSGKPPATQSDADLIAEFEKMLNS